MSVVALDKTPQRLADDIAATRQALGETLAALEHKLAPRQILGGLIEAAVTAGAGAEQPGGGSGDALAALARHRPLAMGAAAFVAGAIAAIILSRRSGAGR